MVYLSLGIVLFVTLIGYWCYRLGRGAKELEIDKKKISWLEEDNNDLKMWIDKIDELRKKSEEVKDEADNTDLTPVNISQLLGKIHIGSKTDST